MIETKTIGLRDESTFYSVLLIKGTNLPKSRQEYEERYMQLSGDIIENFRNNVEDYLIGSQGFGEGTVIFLILQAGNPLRCVYDPFQWRYTEYDFLRGNRALFSAHQWLREAGNWEKVETGDLLDYNYLEANDLYRDGCDQLSAFFNSARIQLLKNGVIEYSERYYKQMKDLKG
jgi:hypothetical protein